MAVLRGAGTSGAASPAAVGSDTTDLGPVSIQAIKGETGILYQILDPNGVVLASIDGSGNLSVAGTSTLTGAVSSLTMADGGNIVLGSTTGTEIGTAGTQKLGFYGATPVVQGAGYSVSGSNATKALAGDGTDTLATVGEVLGNVVKQLLAYGLLHS